MKRQSDAEPHLLLWDGDCGFCRRSIAYMMRHDRRHRFRAMPYQEAPSPPMTPQLRAACENALHVVTSDGQVLAGARAVLFVMENIGWRRAARLLSSAPLLALCEIIYKIVARNRLFFSRFLFRD